MRKIYRKEFDNIGLRFVVDKNGFLYVSHKDLFNIVKTFDEADQIAKASYLLQRGVDDFLDNQDKTAQVINDDEIGLCYNIFALNTLSSSLADLHDVDSENLRSISYKFHAFQKWFMTAYMEACEFFDIDVNIVLQQAVRSMDKYNPAHIVQVSHIDGVWIAECDDLGLVTEADDYEEMVENCWSLVPDLVELNDIGVESDSVRLKFSHVEEVPMQMVK